jgi:hypothetical protein
MIDHANRAKYTLRKRLDFHCEQSGSVIKLGRRTRPEILPRRRDCRDGASVVRRDAVANEWRISMSRSAKKRSSAKSVSPAKASKPSAHIVADPKRAKSNSSSKQSRVIEMLRSSGGATIAAMMKVTGWQKHSVRGFLASVVRKRLNLKLESTKAGDNRLYRIVSGSDGKPGTEDAKRQAA